MTKSSSKQRITPTSPKTTSQLPDYDENKNDANGIAKTTTKRRRKSVLRDSPQQRSSIYRGVTRHRWTGRFEAHLWDKNCWNQSQSKKGKQVYLGAYDGEETAAHAYDLAALKYWGPDTILNFPLSTYEQDLREMEGQTKEEYIVSIRRKSSGFSRGVSKYRGVARHHHNGRWEARIGRVFGNKYLYLGTYATQEEAATAYDMAAIEYRGLNAVTNFDLSRYIKWLQPIEKNTSSPGQNINNDNKDVSPKNLDQEIGLGLEFLNYYPVDQKGIPLKRPSDGTTASSALELLLQSSKFKEMFEQTATCSSPPSVISEQEAPRSCFPDDIQTSFDFPDVNSFNKEHGILFGDYDSFSSSMFQCELDS